MEKQPRTVTLKTLARAARTCRGCDLYRNATQTVFGEGPPRARLMLIGEQPGDQEDRIGRPFVGPSGKYLDSVLQEAGIDRRQAYLTNAVKHFKWEPRGKRRLHAKPSWREVIACRRWLLEELRLVSPQIVICLGATAAQSLLGKDFRLTHHRGEFLPARKVAPDFPLPPRCVVLATVHPASLLRIPDRDARHAARKLFANEMAVVARKLSLPPARPLARSAAIA